MQQSSNNEKEATNIKSESVGDMNSDTNKVEHNRLNPPRGIRYQDDVMGNVGAKTDQDDVSSMMEIVPDDSDDSKLIYKCTKCERNLSSKKTLINHIRNHLGIRDFVCDSCKKTFTSNAQLLWHKRIHDESIKKFLCNICNHKFRNKLDLDRHLNGHYIGNKEENKNYICSFCGKKFGEQRLLNRHQKIHTGKTNYICNICNRCFTQKSSLEVHLKMHTGQKDFICEICNKEFVYKNIYLNHVKSHKGIKDFLCRYCNKGFIDRKTLMNHEKIHTGQKDHVCSVCNKEFTERSQLRSHYKIHTGEKKFVCEFCGHAFTYKCNLLQHRRTHLKNIPESPSELGDMSSTGHDSLENLVKNFICQFCNRSFVDQNILTNHENTHIGKISYRDSICTKGFVEYSHVQYHYKIHSSEKKFVCELCSHMFANNCNRIQHRCTHIEYGQGETETNVSSNGLKIEPEKVWNEEVVTSNEKSAVYENILEDMQLSLDNPG